MSQAAQTVVTTPPTRGMGAQLLKRWQGLTRYPGGKKLFSLAVGLSVPYTATIGAVVQELTPGHAVVALNDRRRVRNHLKSVHAIALVNLGEFSTGLATLTALPDGFRGILKGIEATYVKKARGRLLAEASVSVPPLDGPTDLVVDGVIRDASGDTVAQVRATWRVGPPKASS